MEQAWNRSPTMRPSMGFRCFLPMERNRSSLPIATERFEVKPTSSLLIGWSEGGLSLFLGTERTKHGFDSRICHQFAGRSFSTDRYYSLAGLAELDHEFAGGCFCHDF